MIADANKSVQSAETTGPTRGGALLPALIALGVFWVALLNQQRLEWAVNPIYSYGWAVPALAGYLAWNRWQSRPVSRSALPKAWFVAGAVILLASYLPGRVIQEANPDWVKVNWGVTALWATLVLLTAGRFGGWRYVAWFAFPVLFTFTALPWPVWMEDSITQNLMRLNAEVSAEALTLLGMPAMAQGNLIQVADRWVNVEEACSGIRSLQTAFMMSLFLGEFYRLGWLRRAGLLVASFAVAFVVNLIRTVVLTNFARTDSIDRWHDTVGNISMVICLVGLWLLAEAMNRKRAGRVASAGEGVTASAPTAERLLPTAQPLSWAGAVTVAAWLVAVEVLTLGWYRLHERALPPPMAWNLSLPQDATGFAQMEFAERTRALLKFNTGTTASWITPSGDQWQMYYLQWDPGRVSKFLSSSHYPTVCLPATGMKLVSETGVWRCLINGVEIPFTTYLFDEGGRDVYVFHAIVEDRPAQNGTQLSYHQVSSTERLDSVWRGERNLGQRVVGIAVRGPMAPSDARAVVSETLGRVVSIDQVNPRTRQTALRP